MMPVVVERKLIVEEMVHQGETAGHTDDEPHDGQRDEEHAQSGERQKAAQDDQNDPYEKIHCLPLLRYCSTAHRGVRHPKVPDARSSDWAYVHLCKRQFT